MLAGAAPFEGLTGARRSASKMAHAVEVGTGLRFLPREPLWRTIQLSSGHGSILASLSDPRRSKEGCRGLLSPRNLLGVPSARSKLQRPAVTQGRGMQLHLLKEGELVDVF